MTPLRRWLVSCFAWPSRSTRPAHCPWLLLIATTLIVSAWAAACARSDTPESVPCPSAISPVNTELLAYLSQARAAHHAADLQEDNGDLNEAIASLRALTPASQQAPSTPETDEILADTYARLGDLESRMENFETADGDVDAGLRLTPAPTYFRGHLLETRGLIEQRRFKSLDRRGDARGAQLARQRAIAAFEASMRVQQAVIRRSIPNLAPSARTP